MRRLAVALAALTLFAAACGDGDGGAVQDPSPSTTPAPSSDGASDTPTGSVRLAVTDVATELDTVWAMAFDPAGTLWFTQRDGRLQQVGGKGRDIPGVVAQGEGGLMGLEIDDQGRFFLMLTTRNDNRIIRLDTLDADPVVLVDGIRKAAIHNGGRLRFGPDGTLYAGTGDAGDTSLPPKPDSLNGKILAIDPDSGDVEVFTRGHRNPQGLCFAADGRFLSTEHGPDRGDEVNVITKGKDYGWPDSSGTGIKNWTPTIAPAGCVVATGDLIPQWTGSMLLTTLKQKDLRQLTFAADGSVAGEEILFDDEYGRLRDVIAGPDGAIYLATSSRDSRGNPRDGDDRILEIRPR